jgi:hypothetical protein
VEVTFGKLVVRLGTRCMNCETPLYRDSQLETFAAELALTAYCVALRTGTQGTWLDLELDLWMALTDKVKTWGQGNGPGAANRTRMASREERLDRG